ncbi:MAG: choice-of-anchor L domain-containing protein [Bacteroidota bacterium]
MLLSEFTVQPNGARANINNESSFPFNVESDDTDLSQVATASLFDATGIEFDFVPLDDKVTFRYVFASEEYCEFVGTTFNNVFGFFVSGPGINGPFDNNAINVATITTLNATTETVSINNINHLSNETFYVSNITTTDAQNCEISYVATFQDLIDYDGFTIALTTSFQVIPCEIYHIRLVIGDVGDANLDSAVFLESKSFDLGEPSTIRAEVPGSSVPIAYEGCVDGQFVFSRSAASNINEALTIDYSISPESEAINGIDFLEIPLSITIPAGDTSVILPILIIEDNITEGPEKLKLELTYDCDCIDPVLVN